jgi:hypothetical protein
VRTVRYKHSRFSWGFKTIGTVSLKLLGARLHPLTVYPKKVRLLLPKERFITICDSVIAPLVALCNEARG